MLSTRIAQIEAALAQIATVGPGYVDLINNFPAVALLRPTVSRLHRANRTIVHTMTFIIRGYVLTDEDSITSSEALARAIEQQLQSISTPLIDDARVLSIDTDEGLLSPYGMCDIACKVTWYE